MKYTIYFFKDYATDISGNPKGELLDLFSCNNKLYYLDKGETVDSMILKIKEHLKGEDVTFKYGKPSLT